MEKVLKSKAFHFTMAHRELAKFINMERISKEDILTITQYGDVYTLFYYVST